MTTMKFIIRVTETTSVLVPDFLTLTLIVPACFAISTCAVTPGLALTNGVNSPLLISLAIGYLTNIMINLADTTTPQERTRAAGSVLLEPGLERSIRESPTDDVDRESEDARTGQRTSFFVEARR
jgi:hypothetical protein